MSELKTTALTDAQYIEDMNMEFRAALAKASKGLTPLDLMMATIDWFSHLAISPGTVLKLSNSFLKKTGDVSIYSMLAATGKADGTTGPASNIERRMSGEAWNKFPFNALAHSHKLAKDWVDEASGSVEGVSDEHKDMVKAIANQMLDMMSPANMPLTNPEVIEQTKQQRGMNIVRGLGHLVEDTKRSVLKTGAPEADFKVGVDLAITPGKVIFQNDLIELIQYSPVTKQVGAEPVLICPAWIMKYYILDLSPKNSLVKYLTEQGKTVFMISWKNPDEEDRDVGFEDYITEGLMEALDAVSAVCPKQKINAVGYCIGGTLLAATAAMMARDGDDRLKSISMFAAQVDFSDAGEIKRYVSPSQLSFLDSLMWKKGYLDSEKMGGAFGALRASDLIFGGKVDRYFMGNKPPKIDLMSWNADGTRMPYRMHSEYLKQLYLENNLSMNKFKVGGKPVSISDIRVPVFLVGTETDHVAPWHSVYRFHNVARTEITFLLTSGGHNAGIISGREHPRRRYRINKTNADSMYIDPETWIDEMEPQQGSWWPVWDEWLDGQITKKRVPPYMGASRKGYKPLHDAPGEYVMG